MKLAYQNRTGLLPEHQGVDEVRQRPHERVRLTIPAREALERAGARIEPNPPDGGAQTYRVELLDKVPDGLVAAQLVGAENAGVTAVRRDDEPPYPGEINAYWEQLDFSPCPECGAPLVWYEAGFVPGYRVCTRAPHHHVLAQ